MDKNPYREWIKVKYIWMKLKYILHHIEDTNVIVYMCMSKLVKKWEIYMHTEESEKTGTVVRIQIT